jgi:RimJ/RimL family protein N-acetyltransferase
VISSDVFRDQPTLTGTRVRLEPLGSKHFEGLWPMFAEPEGKRLTGTHQRVTEEAGRRWLATRQDHHDRADWAIVRLADDVVLGEVVLNELDAHNASVSFRISLVGPQVFGRGYGTEATQLVVNHAFDVAGLHRIQLEVYDFNPRAQRVYEKCGFIREGLHRDALHWDGQWHDAIFMSILSTDPRPSFTEGVLEETERA